MEIHDIPEFSMISIDVDIMHAIHLDLDSWKVLVIPTTVSRPKSTRTKSGIPRTVSLH